MGIDSAALKVRCVRGEVLSGGFARAPARATWLYVITLRGAIEAAQRPPSAWSSCTDTWRACLGGRAGWSDALQPVVRSENGKSLNFAEKLKANEGACYFRSWA